MSGRQFSMMLYMADTLRANRIIAEHLPEDPVIPRNRGFCLTLDNPWVLDSLNGYVWRQFEHSQVRGE